MADPNLINQLSGNIKSILEFKKKSLISRAEWGTIKFSNAEPDLDRIFSVLSYLDMLPLNYLPDQIPQQIINSLNEIRTKLEQINNFTIEQPNATQLRDQLVAQIHQLSDRLYSVAAQWIPFLAYQKGDVAQNIEKLSASISAANELIDKAKKEISTKSNEINEIIIKAKEASGKAGAAVFTEDFDKESLKLSKNAKKWLFATALLGSLTLVVAILTWFWTLQGLDQGQIWQKVASKFIALTILLTATLWCGKIYKALMHQATMNRHRALSLQTFQAFSSAASDVQTKDAVLLEATRSIFTQGITGYVDSASTCADSEARVVEIVKSIVPKK